MTSTAIIIVNWNGTDDTLACLDSLLSMTSQDFQAYVVDNHSAQEQFDRLQQVTNTHSRVTLIRAEANLGYSGGNNLGLRAAEKAGHDFCIILNNDTTVDREFLGQLLAHRQNQPGPAVWGGAIFYPDKKKIYALGGGHLSFFSPIDALIGARQPAQAASAVHVKSLGYIAGCCLAFDTDVLRQVGYFDDDYFLYSEEADWCVRVRRHGLPLRYCASAIVYHAYAQSTGQFSPTYVYYFLRNKLLFARKQLEWYHWPSYILIYLVAVVPGFLFLAWRRRANVVKDIWAGVGDGLRGRRGQRRLPT